MILNYSTQGEAVPDFRIQSSLLTWSRTKSRREKVNVANFLVLRTAQVMIAEGKLDPIDIQFTLEGKEVSHDHLGHLLDVPLNHGNPLALLEMRFKHALQSRVVASLTADQQKLMKQAWIDWFHSDVLAAVTVQHPLLDELTDSPFYQDATVSHSDTKPTRFFLRDDSRRHIEPDTVSDDEWTVCMGWSLGQVTTPSGESAIMPVLMTSKVPLTVEQLAAAAYDQDGFKLVVKPFDAMSVLVNKGGVTSAVVDSRFDLVR